jgi:ATP-binding cassette, subfamily C (CFTR/MRP), member 1
MPAQTPVRKEDQSKPSAAKKKPLPKGLSGPSAIDVADLTRRTGDISVYKYYAASIGWKILLGLLLSVALNTLSAAFPRET